jgi:hypothetical protein
MPTLPSSHLDITARSASSCSFAQAENDSAHPKNARGKSHGDDSGNQEKAQKITEIAAMRLTELDPRWSTSESGRHGMGINFLCPICKDQYLGIFFENPIDGGAMATPDELPTARWKRTGDTFDNLTLTPSVDASGGAKDCTPASDGTARGHWHGHITDGNIS